MLASEQRRDQVTNMNKALFDKVYVCPCDVTSSIVVRSKSFVTKWSAPVRLDKLLTLDSDS